MYRACIELGSLKPDCLMDIVRKNDRKIPQMRRDSSTAPKGKRTEIAHDSTGVYIFRKRYFLNNTIYSSACTVDPRYFDFDYLE